MVVGVMRSSVCALILAGATIGATDRDLLRTGRRNASAICAGSHGDYNDPQWTDSGGNCYVEMTSQDWSISMQYVMDITGPCNDEVAWLMNQASITEWTGNYSGYAAITNLGTGMISFHYDAIFSSWLWAHEAAH